MSLRYKGGVISATPPTTTGGTSGTAPGVWTLEQQLQAQAASLWPVSPPPFGAEMRSLRFNSADSAYLNRTPGSAGNQRTWTFSFWYKKTQNSTNGNQSILGVSPSGSSYATIRFGNTTSDALCFDGDSGTFDVRTSAVFRDPSAWYHFVVSVDTTQATASNRVIIYVNNVQQTLTGTQPTQNYQTPLNSVTRHDIGNLGATYSSYYINGYLTEINFIDGQALTPSSFGQTNSTTGVWEPKVITGLTYGTNGFYLKFQDNSGTTATTLGKDSSGNSNNYTPNNFSVTAGTGNDSLVDTPYPYGTDTGAGGEVRGNYCTLNPLRNGLTLSNGNLDGTITTTGAWRTAAATFGISSGKWYWEGTCTKATDNQALIGIINANASVNSYAGVDANGYAYYTDGSAGYKITNANPESYGASFTTNDVIGVALDMDAGTLVFYKNGVSQGTAYSSLTGTWFPSASVISSSVWNMNFGQRPFAYTAPSGFKALVTQNLPTPTIVQPDDYFNTVLYTGNGNTGRSITGVGFQPDFVWNKARSAAYSNRLADAVRGATKLLNTDSTGAEFTDTESITAFNSDGFTVGNSFDNTNAVTYVAWNWKANGAGSSNTAGTITSTVSANTTSGFSIATFTIQTSGSATVGHGLGVAPSLILVKTRNLTFQWDVYHASLGKDAYLVLNDTSAQVTGATTVWNSTAPTSTVFSLGSAWASAAPGNTAVAYCFAPVAGFSAFGSYTGNGSIPGPFVYTGFRPAWILIKRATTAGMDWVLYDNKRSPINVVKDWLYPNLANAEQVNDSFNHLDFVSNGFRVAPSGSVGNYNNTNGATYIYAAFAENPFKYALAR